MAKKKKKKKKPGRPKVTKEQLQTWLDEIRPFLVGGCTLRGSLDRAGLLKHKDTVYENYKLGGWFSDKIDEYQAILGEHVNESFHDLVALIKTKIKQEKILSRDEIRILEFVAEKHRTSQPFFVSRVETAKAKEEDFGKVVERPTIEVNLIEDGKPKKKKAKDKVQPDAKAGESVESPEG